MLPLSNELTVAIIGGIFLLAAGLVTYVGTRGRTKADARGAYDKRIDERLAAQADKDEERIAKLEARVDKAESRVDELEQNDTRKMGAVARILRSIAQQWPDDQGPDLDPVDLAEIEDTIPAPWWRRRPINLGQLPPAPPAV